MASDELDPLYAAPLERFVEERKALAARLRAEGRRDEAAEAAKLPKPSIAAWTVNQLARRRTPELRRLLRATDDLRRIQAGGGDAQAFRQASGDLRSALAILAASARELLREADRAPSDSTIAKVAETLRAAAADEAARPLLEQGRLTGELEGVGFGSLGALTLAPAAKKGAKPDPAAQRREREALRKREREAALKAARRDAKEAEAAAAAARKEAERLERAAAAAARAVERLERDLRES